MSRSELAGPATAPGGQRRGRHRMDRPSGVRCTDMPAVRERLQPSRRGLAALFSALFPTVSAGRHTWDFLANAGGRPRTAFAIILSL
jgi:hypothetical protein